MKQVILVRHAKSSWEGAGLSDHDRPLNKRGRAAAPVIGGWLAGKGITPDIVLCSSAERSRQTHAGMAEAHAGLPEPVIEETLYHAAPGTIRDRLRALDGAVGTALLIGHQPGLGSFARKLSTGRVRPRCARAFEHFPTASAAVLEVDIEDWSAIDYGIGRFTEFAIAREIEAA